MILCSEVRNGMLRISQVLLDELGGSLQDKPCVLVFATANRTNRHIKIVILVLRYFFIISDEAVESIVRKCLSSQTEVMHN